MRGWEVVLGTVKEGPGDLETGDFRAASLGWRMRGSEVGRASRGALGSAEVRLGAGHHFLLFRS